MLYFPIADLRITQILIGSDRAGNGNVRYNFDKLRNKFAKFVTTNCRYKMLDSVYEKNLQPHFKRPQT